MTGPHRVVSEAKKERIAIMTKQRLSTSVIATRLGLSREGVYQYQVDNGLREVVRPRKKGGES